MQIFKHRVVFRRGAAVIHRVNFDPTPTRKECITSTALPLLLKFRVILQIVILRVIFLF